MNSKLQDFARTELLRGLSQLPTTWQRTFRLMYGRKNGKRSVENAETMPIEDVVAEIPDEKLDWAMQQVERSLEKNAPQNTKEAVENIA